MTVEELFERRLVFVAGKGGVGKSTIAAALGLTAARMGKRVCLVESDGQEQMANMFRTPPVGFEGRTLAPNIRGISITTEEALKEFASTRLPLHTISQHLISNRLVRYFLDATPGLKELLILIKITDLIQEFSDELFIVDLPATGHGLAMLNVPDVVIRVVHAGPLRHHAEVTSQVINDPEICAICFVTLAEELATTEVTELYRTIRRTMNIACGPVIANGVHLHPFGSEESKGYRELKKRWSSDEEKSRLIQGVEMEMSRAKLNDRYLKKLQSVFRTPPVIVPFIFTEAVDRNALARISEELSSGGTS